MTQFTSFVAVEEMVVTVGGEPTTIAVPVEMPEGVSYEGVFGDVSAGSRLFLGQQVLAKRQAGPMRAYSYGPGVRSAAVSGRVDRSVPMAAERLGASVPTDRPEPGEAPGAKLAEPLRDLAENVAKQGKRGNLTIGKLRVMDWRVDVMIYLRDSSDATVEALKKLGLVQTGQSKAIHLVIGTIDVRKLGELARLDAVIRVAPVGPATGPKA
jgi:Ca-activated chloride channel family protein